ncbi:RNA recognition motif (RRM, RBD, or RNP domain) [Novymonas esmeraldas]|uniref:RNA recognition motif (RRM, RBD, or RNP domain) n=1 Tax=Novymonas esmeraldas TaxID=1808958 RepID=A0AAW0F2X3_9TRYP
MYLPNASSSSQMMQFPSNQSQQQFSAISSYTQQPPFIVPHPQQQGVYQSQNSQLVSMNIPSQSNQQYVSQPTGTIYEGNLQGSMNQTSPTQNTIRHNRTQMVPVASNDERYRKQLIVNYLAQDVTSADLHTLFARFGPLDGARIIFDRQTSMPRGYGFVYFRYPDSAKQAVDNMNGYEFHGKRLKVGYSTNPLNIISSGSTSQYPPGPAK